MRYLVLSDIHANVEGLDTCLADAAPRGYDRVLVLGDIVGYGADPAACVEIVREACARGAVAVAGNHDVGAAGTAFDFNESAAEAIGWTRAMLDDDAVYRQGDGNVYVDTTAAASIALYSV